MKLSLLNDPSFEEGCCCQQKDKKTWKNSFSSMVLLLLLFVGSTAFAFPPTTPTISSFLPTTAAQGDTVVIHGTNFVGVTAVSFGGTPAMSYIVNSPTQITAIVGSGSTGSVKVTAGSSFGTKTGFTFVPAPSCNLSGILKACLADGNISITTTVQFSTATPTLTYSFPAGPQNTTGAFLVSTGTFIYDPINNIGTQTTIINPGTTGGQILFQLNVTNAGGQCTCSKSITIVDLNLEIIDLEIK